MNNIRALLVTTAIALCSFGSASAQSPLNPAKAAVMNTCMKKKTCRFHIVGGATLMPKGVFSITPAEWKKFNDTDKVLYSEFAQLWLYSVFSNPVQMMIDPDQGARMNPQAPGLRTFAKNIQAHLNTVEFLVTPSKMKNGTPGWSEGETVKELEVHRAIVVEALPML